MNNKYIRLRVTTLRKQDRATQLRMIAAVSVTPAVIAHCHEIVKDLKKSWGCRKCLIELFEGDPRMGKPVYSEQC